MNLTRAFITEVRQMRLLWRKSDDQYAEKPTAMCAGWRELDDTTLPCPNVAHPDYDVCDGCRKHRRPNRKKAA